MGVPVVIVQKTTLSAELLLQNKVLEVFGTRSEVLREPWTARATWGERWG